MSISAELLAQHLAYTAWASERLVRAVGQISPEHRTILGTLVHYAEFRTMPSKSSRP